jgi:hypothetical protein
MVLQLAYSVVWKLHTPQPRQLFVGKSLLRILLTRKHGADGECVIVAATAAAAAVAFAGFVAGAGPAADVAASTSTLRLNSDCIGGSSSHRGNKSAWKKFVCISKFITSFLCSFCRSRLLNGSGISPA